MLGVCLHGLLKILVMELLWEPTKIVFVIASYIDGNIPPV